MKKRYLLFLILFFVLSPFRVFVIAFKDEEVMLEKRDYKYANARAG